MQIQRRISYKSQRLLFLAAITVCYCATITVEAFAETTNSYLSDVLKRELPGWEKHFRFVLQRNGKTTDQFTVSTDLGIVRVSGNSPSALSSGVGWYLKYGPHIQVSSNGAPIPRAVVTVTPLGQAKTLTSSVTYRYALNQNTDGYTSPYWDWPHWEHELDVYALAGINTLLIERATEAVIARTFAQFGYSDFEIRQKLTMPAHLNWQLMGDMCCFAGPPTQELLEERIASTQRILARVRALGMTPVLPGFYGMVPSDFKKRFPHAHVIEQGTWNGFERPAWLDPRDPLFAKIATTYYDIQRRLFGNTSIYDLELFQEGGTPENVPLRPAVAAIEKSLQSAHPGARWMILGWQNQPAREILEVVPHKLMFVIDLHQNAVRRPDRGADLLGADYLYGALWEYGGRTTLGGEAYDYGVRLPVLPAKQPNMIGMGVFPESMDNNPFLFDLVTEAAWHRDAIDLFAWTREFSYRRYGRADSHATSAWLGLLKTVYSKQAIPPGVRVEDDVAPFESLFNAKPSLEAKKAFKGGSTDIYYDFEELHGALTQLLKVPKSFDRSSAYRYDVVDVARQVIANEARVLLPKIKVAYQKKSRADFTRLTQLWLDLIDMQDKLLGSNEFFRVGRWLSFPDRTAGTADQHKQMSYDARSLLTSWGDRTASDDGQLQDYGNKDWQGLTKDYYRKRWAIFFQNLDEGLERNRPPKIIDWFSVAEAWNRGTEIYSPLPEGNPREQARKIDDFLRYSSEAAVLR